MVTYYDMLPSSHLYMIKTCLHNKRICVHQNWLFYTCWEIYKSCKVRFFYSTDLWRIKFEVYIAKSIVQSTIVLYEDTKYSVYPSFSYNFSDWMIVLSFSWVQGLEAASLPHPLTVEIPSSKRNQKACITPF